jgi:hypothetical protein
MATTTKAKEKIRTDLKFSEFQKFLNIYKTKFEKKNNFN